MRRATRAAAEIALATLGLLSCGHSTTGPSLDQLTLDVVSGNGQSAVVGAQLAPLIVKVTTGGNPVAGIAVTFAVTSGGGSVTGASASSGSNGIATVGSWTLGPTAGINTLTATSPGLGSPLTFTATATGPAGLNITNYAGDRET